MRDSRAYRRAMRSLNAVQFVAHSCLLAPNPLATNEEQFWFGQSRRHRRPARFPGGTGLLLAFPANHTRRRATLPFRVLLRFLLRRTSASEGRQAARGLGTLQSLLRGGQARHGNGCGSHTSRQVCGLFPPSNQASALSSSPICAASHPTLLQRTQHQVTKAVSP